MNTPILISFSARIGLRAGWLTPMTIAPLMPRAPPRNQKSYKNRLPLQCDYLRAHEQGISMKVFARSIGALCGFLLMASGMAFAQNPHFVGIPKASLTTDFAVAVKFKEAGLGANENINYTVSAQASGACACVTHNGNCPAAVNKFPPIQVTGEGTFNSGRNGSISGTITTDPPECQQISPASCPRGQTNTLVSIAYTNITIKDDTTSVGPVLTSPDTLSASNSTCQ
jgi:hypothetical protein